jgi:hypothetical protein
LAYFVRSQNPDAFRPKPPSRHVRPGESVRWRIDLVTMLKHEQSLRMK